MLLDDLVATRKRILMLRTAKCRRLEGLLPERAVADSEVDDARIDEELARVDVIEAEIRRADVQG